MSEYADQVLRLHSRRKDEKEADRLMKVLQPQLDLNKAKFDSLMFNWNPDGTLNTLTVDNGKEVYTLHFAWNADGTLHQIMRR